MQTRGRAKAQTVPSSGNPVIPLEGQGSRPPSIASEDEGDLGLVSLLGEGAVSDVGGNYTRVSASSGPGDVTVVAAQAPISEVEVTSSNGQIEVGSADPLLSTVSTTRLPDTCAQAPIGSTQVSAFFSGRGNEPVQLPSLHPGGEAGIPTNIHRVSKHIPAIFSCNSRKHCGIFIMFGTDVTEKVSNQQMLSFPTTPS